MIQNVKIRELMANAWEVCSSNTLLIVGSYSMYSGHLSLVHQDGIGVGGTIKKLLDEREGPEV